MSRARARARAPGGGPVDRLQGARLWSDHQSNSPDRSLPTSMTVSTPFGPVERRTVADEIRERITDSIRSGELQAGQRLPAERELCQQFQVARTSVREAIQGLVSPVTWSAGATARTWPSGCPRSTSPATAASARSGSCSRRGRSSSWRSPSWPSSGPRRQRDASRDRGRLPPRPPPGRVPRQDQAFHSAIAEACGNPC